MVSRVLEYYRHMFTPTPISKEVAQPKFVRTSIVCSPIFKEVAQFKIATDQIKQHIVPSYAKIDFYILVQL